MRMAAKNRSSSGQLQTNDSQSKRFKFTEIFDDDKLKFLISNCMLLDPVYLESLNVLPPLFLKDLDSKCRATSFEMFCPYYASKMNTAQSPLTSLISFVEAIGFLDAFENGKAGSWLNFLHFAEIIPPDFQPPDEDFLSEFVQSFQIDEDSFILNFHLLRCDKQGVFTGLQCNFFKFFSNFCFKKVVIKHFYPENDVFRAFVCFLVEIRTSIVHLEFNCNDFSRYHQHKRKLFFPNLKNLLIDGCCQFYKLGIHFGTSLVSFELTTRDLYFDAGISKGTDIFSFSKDRQNKAELKEPHLVTFLQRSTQLENFTYSSWSTYYRDKEMEEALYSLKNLKKLNYHIESPIETYLGSKKIEKLVIYHQNIGSQTIWDYLLEFPLLSHLDIRYRYTLNHDFISYLQLDRLEYLLIEECRFKKEDEKEFFECISNLKRLKILAVAIIWTKNIVLADSIECAELSLSGIKSEYQYSGSDYSKYLSEEFPSFLPSAANVKYLKLLGRFLNSHDDICFPNLKDHFPKLEKLNCSIRFRIKPEGFSIVENSDQFRKIFKI